MSYAHAEYHVTHASVSGKSDAIIATSLTQNAVKQAIRGRTDVNSRSASRSYSCGKVPLRSVNVRSYLTYLRENPFEGPYRTRTRNALLLHQGIYQPLEVKSKMEEHFVGMS